MSAPTWPCLLLAAGSSCVLGGCPQLLTDDFRMGVTVGPGGMGGEAGATGGATGPLDGGLPSPNGGAGGTSSGTPDAASGDLAALQRALAHRYGFDGLGVDVVDSLGGPAGYIYGAELQGEGSVTLAGSDQYVSLPNGLLSSSNDKTVEVWLTWRGGAAWQRVFDFGSSSAGELLQGTGRSYLFLSAASPAGVMLVAYSQNGFANEVRLAGSSALPSGVLTHVAVVVGSGADTLALYLDGSLHAMGPLTQRLADILDVNLWIGRSQYVADPGLDADVTEVRIYDAALDAEQVALSHRLGPDGFPGGAR